jgi:hypothetical protein
MRYEHAFEVSFLRHVVRRKIRAKLKPSQRRNDHAIPAACSVYAVETVKHFSPALAELDLKSEFFDSL